MYNIKINRYTEFSGKNVTVHLPIHKNAAKMTAVIFAVYIVYSLIPLSLK
jgi:hypothetical protein